MLCSRLLVHTIWAPFSNLCPAARRAPFWSNSGPTPTKRTPAWCHIWKSVPGVPFLLGTHSEMNNSFIQIISYIITYIYVTIYIKKKKILHNWIYYLIHSTRQYWWFHGFAPVFFYPFANHKDSNKLSFLAFRPSGTPPAILARLGLANPGRTDAFAPQNSSVKIFGLGLGGGHEDQIGLGQNFQEARCAEAGKEVVVQVELPRFCDWLFRF